VLVLGIEFVLLLTLGAMHQMQLFVGPINRTHQDEQSFWGRNKSQ